MSPEQVKLRVRCDEVSVSVQDNYRQHLGFSFGYECVKGPA